MFRSLDFSPGPNPKPRLGLKSEFLNPDSSKRDLPRILLQANVSRGTGLGRLPLRHFLTIEDDGDRPVGITLIGPTFQGPAIKKLHPFASKQVKRQTKKNRDQFHCGIIPKYPGKRQAPYTVFTTIPMPSSLIILTASPFRANPPSTTTSKIFPSISALPEGCRSV